MGRTTTAKQPKDKAHRADPFQLREDKEAVPEREPLVHVFGKQIVCDTDSRGYPTPRNRSPLEIVLEASEGFIPLWAKNLTLRWRFQERSLRFFRNPDAVKAEIKELLGDALLAWDDAAPIRFTEDDDLWDFEIVIRKEKECDIHGCVLASAFFPDAGRHELVVYPSMFEQSRKEQVDTFIHEIGHVFGLRHFFADVRETAWPVEIYGTHKPFSIMNYGAASELSAEDKADLRQLYHTVWNGRLSQINGTPIRLVRPYHLSGDRLEEMMAATPVQAVLQPQSWVANTSAI